jgi:hypothetical protein
MKATTTKTNTIKATILNGTLSLLSWIVRKTGTKAQKAEMARLSSEMKTLTKIAFKS